MLSEHTQYILWLLITGAALAWVVYDAAPHGICLDATMVALENQDRDDLIGTTTVSVLQIEKPLTKSSFVIGNVFQNYHPLEKHSCAIYVIRQFNFDEKNSAPRFGFETSFWKYSYDGHGEKLFNFINFDDVIYNRAGKNTFGYDFRVSPNERYVALKRGYMGGEVQEVVVKDLSDKDFKEVFVLSMKDINVREPDIVGSISFLDWSRDGRYLWIYIFDAAYPVAYVRIDFTNFAWQVFTADKDALGGDVLNYDTGLVTISEGADWIPDEEFQALEKEERRKTGIGSALYIQNLFTKEKQLVTEVEEPLWYSKPKWISDTELEYTMPDNELRRFLLIDSPLLQRL